MEIRYSNVTDDSTTGDLSGFEFRFSEAGNRLIGSFREAAGEFGGLLPLALLEMDTSTDSVSFAMPNGSDSSWFRGRISCDSLSGRLRAFRTTEPEPITFLRTP